MPNKNDTNSGEDFSKNGIDYWLLWKNINDHALNRDEKDTFSFWLNEKEEHQTYFAHLKASKKSEFDRRNIQFDSYQAWKKLHIEAKKKKRSYWKLSIAASILLVIGSYMFWDFSQKNLERLKAENISFEPGVQKATLIFNDGSHINLNERTDTVINAPEVIIKNNNKTLDYKKTAKTTTKLKYNKLIIPRGAEYFIILSDGTKVWVNSETILRYPETFGKKERRVQLIGEAYFEVKSDSSRLFIVNSGMHNIKVYGTSFNIKAYTDDQIITTTLVEGLVKVSSKSKREDGIELSPGYQSVFEKETESINLQKVDIKQHTAWKDGRFLFRKMSLNEIMRVISRWYDVDVVFENQALKEIQFNGNLKRYDNIQSLLDQLTKTNEIEFTAYGKKLYVN